MKTIFFPLFFVVAGLIVLMGACTPAPTPVPQTSTPPLPTDTATPVPTSTPSPTPTFTPTFTPTSTPTPTDTPTPTITPNATETQMYTNMLGRVQEYFDKGYISSTNGDYHRLSDFADDGTGDTFAAYERVYVGREATWLGSSRGWRFVEIYKTVPYWYRENSTGLAGKDFIIIADITWGPNAPVFHPYAGCGFTFHLNGNNETHLLAYVTTFHTVDMRRTNTEVSFLIFSHSFAALDPNGLGATLTLVVNGTDVSTFLDGDFVYTYKNPIEQGEYTPEDALAYAIVSDENNKPRCAFSNVELWVVKP